MGWPYDNNSTGFQSPETNFEQWQWQNGFALGGNNVGSTPSYQETDALGLKLSNQVKPEGFGLNNSTLNAGGSALQGIGSLAGAWAALQNVKLGEERLAMQDQQFGANFSNQATLLNNQVNKHNNWAASNPGSSTYDRVSTDYKKI